MLPRPNRLRRSEDFRRAVRRGRRVSSATLVIHAVDSGDDEPARVGFVVSTAVGNAVTRNQVKRRLRSAVLPHLARLGHVHVVIRAQPAAASAEFRSLVGDLERCLNAVGGRR